MALRLGADEQSCADVKMSDGDIEEARELLAALERMLFSGGGEDPTDN